MVTVRRDGFSNDQWLMEGPNLLELKYTKVGTVRVRPVGAGAAQCLPRRIASDRSTGALASLPRDGFDYVWLIDTPPYNPALVAGMQPVWRGRGSILYRLHP